MDSGTSFFQPVIITAFIAAITALVTTLITSTLATNRMKLDYKYKFRLETIQKKILACEELWKILQPASITLGKPRIISIDKGDYYVMRDVAKQFYTNLSEIMFSSHGLYYSADLRMAIYKLRDCVKNQFLLGKGGNLFKISPDQKELYLEFVTMLIDSVRREMGVEQIKVEEMSL